MIIGIDFSIKSPGMTILESGRLHFYAFPRDGAVKEGCLQSLQKAEVEVYHFPAETPLSKNATIADRERSSFNDAVTETNHIIAAAANHIQHCNEEIYFAIEGFSFGSTSNRLAQLSGYQWLLRYRLIERLAIKVSHFYTFSPMTVKATAGKGNLKKEGMIEAFIHSEDPLLCETNFWKAISSDPAQFQTKKGSWLSPIDDIVDSYWAIS